MKKITLALAVAISTAALYSCSDNSTDTPKDSVEAAKDANDTKDDKNMMAVSEDDAKFLVFAANAGMTEIEAAKAASTMATNAKTKEFAAMMTKDHTAASDELKGLASTKSVTLPAAISDDNRKEITDLNEKKGADFDKAYMSMMVDEHKDVVDKFKTASENCKDTEIKAWAAKMLPTLQAHHDQAKVIHDGLK